MGHTQKCDVCGKRYSRVVCQFCGAHLCFTCYGRIGEVRVCCGREPPIMEKIVADYKHIDTKMAKWLGISKNENPVVDLCPKCRKQRTEAELDTLKAIFGGMDPRRCLRCLTEAAKKDKTREPVKTAFFPLQPEAWPTKKTSFGANQR